jgi:hypothetical protein
MTLLMEGPIKPWIGETAEQARTLDRPDYTGFEILQDSRIIDMRAWNSAATGKDDHDSLVYGYRRVKVLKRTDHQGNNLFRMNALATHPKTQIRFPAQAAQPKLRMTSIEEVSAIDKGTRWEVNVDFSRVPAGDFIDIIYEHISPGVFLHRGANSTSISYEIQADTAEETRWFLLPRGKEYRNFRILHWPTGQPEKVEPVKMVNEFMAEDSTILAYKLLSVKAGYTHEVTWFYK